MDRFSKLTCWCSIIVLVSVLQNQTATCGMISKYFKPARFLGNESVVSIGFNPINKYLTVADLKIVECMSTCTKFSDCNSVNWIRDNLTLGFGRCEVINASAWKPNRFSARLNEISEFYLDVDMMEMARLEVVPAVVSSTGYVVADPTKAWPSGDCMFVSGSTGGFIMGLANNRTASKCVQHFKCRVFRHGFAMSDTTPVTVSWASYSQNMTCPSGWVMTAALEDDGCFMVFNDIRCMKPALPWFVNMTQCYVKKLKTYDNSPTPSPMKTANLDADAVWGAQCGNSTTIEAMVAINFIMWDFVFDNMICCKVEYLA